MELRELYQTVADRLAAGVEALEAYLQELETARSLPFANRKEQLEPIQIADVLPEESAVHRAAAFLATYFTDLRQHDFNRLVLILVGDETFTVERTKQVAGKDGTATTVTEETRERWSDHWAKYGDGVFRDCRLRPVVSSDGSWVVDFNEPYLRRELRAHFERHLPWYLKRQCQTLQESGALFAFDLSPAAVEGLVALFVERAVVDPMGFGSAWLLDLVRGLRIQVNGKPPSDLPQETHLAAGATGDGARLLAHFHGRLALLIREMLDQETLRPMVSEFFEYLIAARQHSALLDVIVGLARRLRFVPHFDPLIWMRRLLDQGTDAVRQRTAEQLVALARDSGPRIYEFLAAVRSWLPEEGRPASRFSRSSQEALEFPFAYCAYVAESLDLERLGTWPSPHPLFYTLPGDRTEARREIATLVAWILDARGADYETTDKPRPAQSPRAVRIGHAAALVEHWSWVLEGGGSDYGSPEGRALFGLILDEIIRQIGAPERSWFRRSWQGFNEECLQAAGAGDIDVATRQLLVARGKRLTRIKTDFDKIASAMNGGTAQ